MPTAAETRNGNLRKSPRDMDHLSVPTVTSFEERRDRQEKRLRFFAAVKAERAAAENGKNIVNRRCDVPQLKSKCFLRGGGRKKQRIVALNIFLSDKPQDHFLRISDNQSAAFGMSPVHIANSSFTGRLHNSTGYRMNQFSYQRNAGAANAAPVLRVMQCD